jgi:hypothetical protein
MVILLLEQSKAHKPGQSRGVSLAALAIQNPRQLQQSYFQ